MKKNFTIFILFILCLCSVFAKTGAKMYVKVEEAVLKESPSFWGRNGASVFYGEEVVVLEEKNSWKKVQLVIDSSVSGWISESSLTQKKIVASGNRVSASTEELALAGKGFTAEIEAEYKKQASLNYDAVDKLETNLISFDKVLDFMAAGKLEGTVEEGEE